MKTIIIGDIHAQALQFDRLLNKMEFSPEHDQLILLGDLIDRGDDAYGVIQRVIRLKNEMGSRLVLIRGSHEKLFLSSSWKDKLLWRAVGRGSTIRSFREYGENLSDYAGWIQENTVLYYEDRLFQCTHAAVKNKPLYKQDDYTLMMDHSLTRKNKYRGKLTITGHIHLKKPTFFDGYGGESFLPYERKLSLPACGVICLDTGCGTKGNPLTGMIVEGTEYRLVSVPPERMRI